MTVWETGVRVRGHQRGEVELSVWSFKSVKGQAAFSRGFSTASHRALQKIWSENGSSSATYIYNKREKAK